MPKFWFQCQLKHWGNIYGKFLTLGQKPLTQEYISKENTIIDKALTNVIDTVWRYSLSF